MTSIVWAIDSCQNRASTDQNHVTIFAGSSVSSSRSHVFMRYSADQLLALNWSQAQVYVFQLVLKSHKVISDKLQYVISWLHSSATPRNYLVSLEAYWPVCLRYKRVFSSTGKKPTVAPYSGHMLAIVALSAMDKWVTPGPKNSTNLPTTPIWRRCYK